jgi:CTP:molybdopterin cytidylyltransferase MocA
MNTGITLLILAAGKGSRYGGTKQFNAIGYSGEYLFEYSIYDAIIVGFEK